MEPKQELQTKETKKGELPKHASISLNPLAAYNSVYLNFIRTQEFSLWEVK